MTRIPRCAGRAFGRGGPADQHVIHRHEQQRPPRWVAKFDEIQPAAAGGADGLHLNLGQPLTRPPPARTATRHVGHIHHAQHHAHQFRLRMGFGFRKDGSQLGAHGFGRASPAFGNGLDRQAKRDTAHDLNFCCGQGKGVLHKRFKAFWPNQLG